MDSAPGEVDYAAGTRASTLFHGVLATATAQHPEAFADVALPADPEGFKGRFGEVLPAFEAARANAAQRSEIAASIVADAKAAFVWRTETDEIPLRSHLDAPAEPLAVEVTRFGGTGALRPEVAADGTQHRGDALVEFARRLVERGSASAQVSEAMSFLVDQAAPDGIDLRGRRIALLGAAAELAPPRLWLEGGADVLWIDVVPPPEELRTAEGLAGTLHWVPDGADLLTQPARVRATLEAFAAGGSIDIGLYAYAAGRGREWRLTGAMNAIVDSLPADLVRTITMLVSPTTPGVLSPDELTGERRRREERPRWQTALERIGLLGRGDGHVCRGTTCANRGVVPIQGVGYQAAQYLGKFMAAETWVTADPPRHVSASIAGISMTESLRHPVFDTAFGGAEAFRVETFDPATTASLNGLLALWEWLDPSAPSHPDHRHATMRDRAAAVASTRVHGGIYELPYPIEPTLRVATAIGVGRDPRRIATLVRRG